ncbi:Rab28/RabF [Giardia muris]|uniref:Rab28/RabF n=1 Tax=Giardia muris TaxID=5742 RepID=A0A4Z1T465_GIAMU|nr:Rab28/RabF [Giardia muris]|eukprot:TNJ28773.1 Rab28/RabF [Giardia muris]
MATLGLDVPSDDELDGPTRVFKVTVVGDGSVGKTSICTRFAREYFLDSYKQTVGLDFFTRTLQLDDGERITFHLYDIGGQSIGSRMLGTYIAGSHALIFVYDLTNHDSLEDILEWYKTLKALGCTEGAVIYLVGNKTDLTTLRAVRAARGSAIAEAITAQAHYLVSAQTGDRIGVLFISLAGLLCGVDVSSLALDQRDISKVVLPERPSGQPEDLSSTDTTQADKAAKRVKGGRCVII